MTNKDVLESIGPGHDVNGIEKGGVLILVGIELIFFVIAATVLYFGFVMKIVLTTNQHLSCCCTVLRVSFLHFSYCPVSKEVEKLMTQTAQRNIPYCMMFSIREVEGVG